MAEPIHDKIKRSLYYDGKGPVPEQIPNNVLEEDPKLLMWYDQAVTRMGGE